MKLGLIGLGRMGANIARRLIQAGHAVIAYDTNPAAVAAAQAFGAQTAPSLPQLTARLPRPRAVWLMLPDGPPTAGAISALTPLLAPGDAILDGGNSNYQDTIQRAQTLAQHNIDLIDVGTSGGIWGLEHGFCLMIGGPPEAVARLRPAFRALTPNPDAGHCHVGPAGAGHYVKMIHNAIEYALMESYAEGFELLAAKPEFDLDLPAIAETWRHGSVIRSWLLDLTAAALKDDPNLRQLQPYVDDSGEGRWAVAESIALAVPAPAITAALQQRFRSRQDAPLAPKLLAALRQKFGGHPVRQSPQPHKADAQ